MAEKQCGIYKITNTVNNKCYIGQSVDIINRWKHHRTLAISDSSSNTRRTYPLYRAIRKYGIEAFTFEIMELCDEAQLNQRESYYIEQYQSDNPKYGYNCRSRYTSRRLTQDEIKTIINLLKESALTINEIADIFYVSSTIVTFINQGKVSYITNIELPVRPNEKSKLLNRITMSKGSYPIPTKNYRQKHTIEQTWNAFIRIFETLNKNKERPRYIRCTQCHNIYDKSSEHKLCEQCHEQLFGIKHQESDNQNEKHVKSGARKYEQHRNRPCKMLEEDFTVDLIDKILCSSKEQVAHEFGYASGNSLKRQLIKHGMPTTQNEMWRYYESITGHKHSTEKKMLYKQKQKEENRRKNMPRRVGQYDEELTLINTFNSIQEAKRNTNTNDGHISLCCRGKRLHANGFIWRYIDEHNNLIDPDSFSPS